MTTADPSLMDIDGTHDQLAERLAAYVEASGRTVSTALVLDHRAAVELFAAPVAEKLMTLGGLLSGGEASLARATPALNAALG